MGFLVIFNCFPNKPSTNVIKGFILDAAVFFFFVLFCFVLFLQPENRATVNRENNLNRREKFNFLKCF